MVQWFVVLVLVVHCACAKADEQPPPAAAQKPADAQHARITTPHGDHSPHHGGVVLMKDELHYEVVIDPGGRHAIWFSNAVREDLPAAVASKVAMTVMRPHTPDEVLPMAIDDSGESWTATGKPVAGDGVLVKVAFVARGEAVDIEVPFVKTP